MSKSYIHALEFEDWGEASDFAENLDHDADLRVIDVLGDDGDYDYTYLEQAVEEGEGDWISIGKFSNPDHPRYIAEDIPDEYRVVSVLDGDTHLEQRVDQ